MTDFENFLDLENYSTVVLTDEEGNEIEFEKLAFMPKGDDLYVVLTPAIGEDEELPEDAELEIAIFRVENNDGEVDLTLITDEDLGNEIIEALIAEDEAEDEGEE